MTIGLIVAAIGVTFGVNELADSELIRTINTFLNFATIIYIARLQSRARSEIAVPVNQLKRELLDPKTDGQGRRDYDTNVNGKCNNT